MRDWYGSLFGFSVGVEYVVYNVDCTIYSPLLYH